MNNVWKIGPDKGKDLWVSTDIYTLQFNLERFFILLHARGGTFYYLLSPISGCHLVGKEDRCKQLSLISEKKTKEGTEIIYEEKSSLWGKKIYHLFCHSDSIEYFYEIEGEGKLDRIDYFRGYYKEYPIGSVVEFDEVYLPCPNFFEKSLFSPADWVRISAGNNSLFGGQAFAAGPFCYGFHCRDEDKWVSCGLAVKPGEYLFDHFDYNYKEKIMNDSRDIGLSGFSLFYYGKKQINGLWETPRLVFNFAKGKKESIKQYITWLVNYGYLPRFGKKRTIYSWWREPIFCGWHEQVALARLQREGPLEGGDLGMFCRQELYEKWLDILEKHGVIPGTVILDASWQKNVDNPVVDTTKWPDLRGFIDRCHQKNQKVILWFNAWFYESVDKLMAILQENKPVAIDPTNPEYERILRTRIKEMISNMPGCLNSDGLKVDGLLSLPSGPGLKNHKDIWGLELQRYYLSLIRDEVKKHKPDAIIGLYVANPYLADLADVVRCGDLYTVKSRPVTSMKERAEILSITVPGVPIDTDGLFRFDYSDKWLEDMAKQAEIGIPCLYNAEKILQLRHFRPAVYRKFSSDDYTFISRIWNEYRKKWDLPLRGL